MTVEWGPLEYEKNLMTLSTIDQMVEDKNWGYCHIKGVSSMSVEQKYIHFDTLRRQVLGDYGRTVRV